MFVGDFLVDGPKVRGWVGLGRHWFVIYDCLLQPEAGRSGLSPKKPCGKPEERPTERSDSPPLHGALKSLLEGRQRSYDNAPSTPVTLRNSALDVLGCPLLFVFS